MRAFKTLMSVLTLVILTASFNSAANAGENNVTPTLVGQPSQMDQWVIRLASDFSIIQSNIEEMIVHYNVSERTIVRLRLLEQNLRDDVMKVIVAANLGDQDTVRRYLPAIAREVQKQILVLTINKDVTRDWAAARTQAQVLITQASLVTTPATITLSQVTVD